MPTRTNEGSDDTEIGRMMEEESKRRRRSFSMANRKSKAVVMFLGLAIFLVHPAFAHEGGKHFMGQVKSVDADSLTIVTKDKDTVTIKLLPTTKFLKSKQPASVQDLKTGERVVVHAKQNGESWIAEEVDFGSSPQKQ
jgi:Cu/Ag efflux protein CusF